MSDPCWEDRRIQRQGTIKSQSSINKKPRTASKMDAVLGFCSLHLRKQIFKIAQKRRVIL